MTFDDLSAYYAANQPLVVGLGALAGVAVLLVAANRLRKMKEHRATLLIANILTIIAAALATMVSASGMWKFFTDILGETPLRIAFFAFIEIALFASALLARSRLLHEPDKGTTGVDGIAVWALAALTATLSALDSDSFREVCLRLVAPLIAAWMWERALAAERNVRLGKTSRRINWTLTPERILVWLRLAEASDRDVSQIDRGRRRAKLGRARLHLHLLQSRNAFAWRIRRAHRSVTRQAMQAAEHIGLDDFPAATNEREAMQMYMATLYGFVDATSPQAVAHLNAWPTAPRQGHVDTSKQANRFAVRPAGLNGTHDAEDEIMSRITNGTEASADHLGDQTAPDDTSRTTTQPLQGIQTSSRRAQAGTAVPGSVAAKEGDPKPDGRRHNLDADTRDDPLNLGGLAFHADGTDKVELDDVLSNHDRPNDEADVTAIAVMRRFWDREVASGRVPSGARLSRAAGVPPTTGLGRRKRREWAAELSEPLKPVAGSGADLHRTRISVSEHEP